MSALFIALALSFAGRTEAPERELTLSSSMGAGYVADSAFRLVSEGSTFPQLELGAGYAPRWLDERLTWHLGLTVGWSGADRFQAWTASLLTRSLHASAGYSLSPLSFARLYGRAGLIFDLATLTVASDSSAGDLVDRSVSAGLLGSLGIEVALGEGAWSLYLESGYGQRLNDLRFDELAPDVESSTPAAISITSVDAGGLDLSGAFWKLGISMRL